MRPKSICRFVLCVSLLLNGTSAVFRILPRIVEIIQVLGAAIPRDVIPVCISFNVKRAPVCLCEGNRNFM